MNSQNKLLKMIQDDGLKETISSLAQALKNHADNLSDMGIKEKVNFSYNVAEMLEDLSYSIDE